MDCKNCGACCLGQDIPVLNNAHDEIAPEFVDAHGCLKQVDGRCVFFDTKTRLCTNYPGRPHVCINFLPGSARCLYTRLWAEVQLDWFNPDRSSPASEETIQAPFIPEMDTETMTVISIPGKSGQLVQSAIDRYNEAVRKTTHF
jgi:hypothetical protein